MWCWRKIKKLCFLVNTGNLSAHVVNKIKILLYTTFNIKYNFYLSFSIWSFVIFQTKCCGLYNYTDFNSALKFNRTVMDSSNKGMKTLHLSLHLIIQIFSVYNLTFPLSCCDYSPEFTISKEARDKCIQTQSSNEMNIGCWSKIKPTLSTYLNYCFTAMGITIAILVCPSFHLYIFH